MEGGWGGIRKECRGGGGAPRINPGKEQGRPRRPSQNGPPKISLGARAAPAVAERG